MSSNSMNSNQFDTIVCCQEKLGLLSFAVNVDILICVLKLDLRGKLEDFINPRLVLLKRDIVINKRINDITVKSASICKQSKSTAFLQSSLL